jgi:DNA polymerase-1
MQQTIGPLDAKIMFVGDFPSEADVRSGRPLSDYAGTTFNNLLAQANIARYKCLVTNLCQDRPPANNISYFFENKQCTEPKPKLAHWLEELKQTIQLHEPNIVVPLGPTALWALTGEKKLGALRGYTLESTLVPGQKTLSTYHPKMVNYDWKLYFQTVLDLRKVVREADTKEMEPDTQVLYPDASYQQFISYMEELISRPDLEYLAIDVETLQPGTHIDELGLSHDPDFGISFFLIKGRTATLCEKDELRLWQVFAELISRKKIVMQNAAYDTGVLWINHGILCKNLWMDTLIAAHCCWPELPRSLEFLGSVCLNVPPWKSGTAKGKDYNPLDAANTLGIAFVLDKEMDKAKVRHTFDFEMNLIPVSLMMQLQGISVDPKMQRGLIKGWTKQRDLMHKQLNLIIGREINFNSPKQMQELLYVDLGLPPQYKRRKSVKETKTLTTDTPTLRKLSRLVPDNPIFNLLLEYKKADKLLKFLDVELSPENKVHTCYNITGAASDDEEDTKKTKRSFGRWSSSKSIILPYGSGNLQNIPRIARLMYKARPGKVIIEADYKQAEAVLVSHYIGDQKLMQMFYDSFGLAGSECAEYDIHKITASDMLGIPISEVTKAQRTDGKVTRHSTNYSAGPNVLALRLQIQLAKAKILMELYHKANPKLAEWHTSIQDELKQTRTLYNVWGREHKFLDRWGDSLFRSAYSFKPQSSIGDLLNRSILRVYNGLPELPFDMSILLQLHDAIYVEVDEDKTMETFKFLRKNMLEPITINGNTFTVDVDFHVKPSWGKGEDVDINWQEWDKENYFNKLEAR